MDTALSGAPARGRPRRPLRAPPAEPFGDHRGRPLRGRGPPPPPSPRRARSALAPEPGGGPGAPGRAPQIPSRHYRRGAAEGEPRRGRGVGPPAGPPCRGLDLFARILGGGGRPGPFRAGGIPPRPPTARRN